MVITEAMEQHEITITACFPLEREKNAGQRMAIMRSTSIEKARNSYMMLQMTKLYNKGGIEDFGDIQILM
uniref:Uncharacterized protein n=1 Tax=Romanomermis culicivorax TaxID=13658 RepID=A0A915ILP8_ROMCU